MSDRLPVVLAAAALVGGALLVLSEGLAFVVSGVFASRGLLVSPDFTGDYAAYLSERDPVVGWPSRVSQGTGEQDASGSRRVPAHPDVATTACVAAFGDSFTWGAEVEAADSYPNLLSKRLGCRVANFGIPGYGTDQALLRYLEVVRVSAPVVVLGHHAENVVRNVNQYRGFYTGKRDLGLKPRFVVDASGSLVRVPLPQLTETEFRELHESPGLLAHEYFSPGGPAGVVVRAFPYTLAVLRALGHYRVRARLRGEPSYAAFYAPGHPSNALAVTTAILLDFERRARERGQQPLVLLIPDQKDLRLLAEGSPVGYAPLVERLGDAGSRPLDAAPGLLSAASGRPPCALYSYCGGGAHLNAEGYGVLADLVFERVEEALAAR